MHAIEEVKARVLELVSRATDQRIRPIQLERTVMEEDGTSKAVLKEALSELVEAKRLVYTYRDPCSFVEIPTVENQFAK